ncbi:efflux RND transporter permease subunit [Clostridium sp. WILCCON 0269]|uniref:Efflux RND transporter permease subunit n=1 Tax=Candidatus Clostridium eludens TaxID=3381663 RepID=A0ABW8SP88_9CLOT
MIEFILKKRKITILFFVVAVIGGIYGFITLPRQESPDVTSYTAMVTTVLPGGTPEKVEQTVTKKIEEKIKEIQGLKSITSESKDSVSIITVEVTKNQKPKEKWDELRKKVQDVEADLPEDAKKPQVNDDLSKTFIQTLNITANSLDDLYNIRSNINSWEDQLKTISGVADVTIIGMPEKQVKVELDTQKLYNYGITWKQVTAAIQGDRDKTPLGNLDNENHRYQLVLDESYDPDELNNVIVSTTKEGIPIHLEDIGKAYMSTQKVDHYVYHNGKPAINISINAESGTDVPSAQKKVTEKIATFKKSMPEGIKFENVYSTNERLNELFSSLTHEAISAIASVLIVCSLGLSFNTSLMIALAIPISMSVSLMLAPIFSVTFNQITVYALIVVLGILVDDAVVVNDNIDRHITDLGEPVEKAAINGPKEVFTSILTATLATIASFLPIAFLHGNVGQFARPLPVIVCIAMITSMFIALTIIPIFRIWHSKRAVKREDFIKPAGLLGKQINRIIAWYANKFMPKILDKPLKAVTVSLLITLCAYSLIVFVPIQLFPKADRAEMLININNQPGSSIKDTNALVEDISRWVRTQPNVKLVSAYAGGPAPSMFLSDETISDSEQSGQVFVKIDKTKMKTSDIIDKWKRDLKKLYPQAEVIPRELQMGFPIGKPVVIRIYGQDIDTLRNLSQEAQSKIKNIDGISNVKDNIGINNYSYKIEINKALMDKMQVNYSDITSTVRLINDGMTIDKFDDKSDVSDIVLYADKPKEDPMISFGRLNVPNAQGQQIPLRQLAKITPYFSINTIPRRNLTRYVEVSADVDGKTAAAVMKDVKKAVSTINLPEGFSWEAGGETIESVDIFVDLIKLLIISAFLIIIIIILQFYSFSAPVIITSTFFLAFGGSIIGLFITGKQLGFMAILGCIALIGIVARNGIVLIEFIENERKRGVELKQAVINAGEARLRPVALTAMTAIAGLIPMSVTGEALFKPMGITIIFGLMYSTILTLVVVPSLYTIIARLKIKYRNLS